ncbi:MAG TPA: 23S rRNA (adenine(2030)-N(6))-methyltransferase RlmJ [Azospirillaceae bacterium]|nr:23S rRNA (adenine(2030)-N(6))-methyltransferase RlmJ [Azospirillaceae bacterium]
MNYRHAFHAGNPADVMKHAVLALILERLTAKPAPFMVLDTHAGIGRYDLEGPEARRTGEADAGIRRLLAAPADAVPDALRPYLAAVRALNAGAGDGAAARWYPGSPRLARAFLRPGDRLVLAELHPEDAKTLKAEFRGDDQTSVHHMDGWTSLKAHLPPKEKRGLVLVDPPFEATDEYERMAAGLALAHGRWPTGVFALWYAIKDRAQVWRFHQALEDSGIPKVLAAELTWAPEERLDRLVGSGMVVVNPPWQLDATLADMLPALHRLLEAPAGGSRVEWIAGEQAGV